MSAVCLVTRLVLVCFLAILATRAFVELPAEGGELQNRRASIQTGLQSA